MTLRVLDYGAGNVRSLVNAVNKLGFDVSVIKNPAEILEESTLVRIEFFASCNR
jgi:glutamine amidotransferase/cyclase